MFAPVTKRSFTPQTFVELAFAAFGAPEAALHAPARPGLPRDPDRSARRDGRGARDRGRRRRAAHARRRAARSTCSRPRERPLVWAGGGAVAAGAGDAVGAVAERLGAPDPHDVLGGAGIAAGHPLHVGLPPHVPEIGAVWDEADLVIAVGSDLDGMMTQNWRMPAPPRLVAHQRRRGRRGEELGARRDRRLRRARRVRGARAASCPARASPWVDVAALRGADDASACTREYPAEMRFLDAFAARVPAEAIVLCDMCIPGYWLGGFHASPAPRRLTYPLGWGTLGCAFPQSLGAALAGGGPAVSVSGDGGFLFACGELATVAQERLAGDDGDRRRRRLRDAALRPAPRGRRRRTGSISTRPTSSRWPRASACAPRRSTGSRTSSPPRCARHVARPGADGPRRPRGARAAADDVAALVPPGALSANDERGASPLAVRAPMEAEEPRQLRRKRRRFRPISVYRAIFP